MRPARALVLSLFAVAACQEEEVVRNSSTLAFSTEGPLAEGFLAEPGLAAVEAWFRFGDDLAENVYFGVDQEFVGGVDDPTRFPNEDFVALVGVTRGGIVVAMRGGPDAADGVVDDPLTWEPRLLGRELAPDVWHHVRVEADFAALEYVRMVVESPDEETVIDLSGVPLAYPNAIPVDGRAMTWYAYAMANELPRGGTGTEVVIDDAAGYLWADGDWRQAYVEGFDREVALRDVPFTFPVMPLSRVEDGVLYRENEGALLRFAPSEGRTGGALVADAALP